MLPSSQESSPSVIGSKKNRLDIFSGIFKKKNKEEEEESDLEEEIDAEYFDQEEEELSRLQERSTPIDIPDRGGVGMPFCVRGEDGFQSHSPVSPRVRNIDRDMEALRLSRQDNPYIQHQLERMSVPSAADFMSPPRQDEERLVEMADDEDSIDYNLHEHLIRSPPPQFPQNVSQFLFPNRPKAASMSVDELTRTCNSSRDLNPLLNKSGVDVLDPGMRAVLEFQRQRLANEHGPGRMDFSSPNDGGRRSVDAMLVSHWSPTISSGPISFHGTSLPGLAFLSDHRPTKTEGVPAVSPERNHSRLSRNQVLNDSRETLLRKTSLDSFG